MVVDLGVHEMSDAFVQISFGRSPKYVAPSSRLVLPLASRDLLPEGHKFQLTEALSKTREKEALNKTRDQDVALQTENHRGCELSHEPRSTTSRTRSTALFAAASSSAILFQLLSVSRAVLSVSWPSAL
jgi:hypothetical protein